jgi:hypothetical protein
LIVQVCIKKLVFIPICDNNVVQSSLETIILDLVVKFECLVVKMGHLVVILTTLVVKITSLVVIVNYGTRSVGWHQHTKRVWIASKSINPQKKTG